MCTVSQYWCWAWNYNQPASWAFQFLPVCVHRVPQADHVLICGTTQLFLLKTFYVFLKSDLDQQQAQKAFERCRVQAGGRSFRWWKLWWHKLNWLAFLVLAPFTSLIKNWKKQITHTKVMHFDPVYIMWNPRSCKHPVLPLAVCFSPVFCWIISSFHGMLTWTID